MRQPITLEDGIYTFNCPHCNEKIMVEQNETACCIFRHGVYKNNMQQIPPHSPKEHCDDIAKNNLIYGCGKPFKFYKGDNCYAEECEYI